VNYLQTAKDHHRDACLDNHTEEECVAVQYAKKIDELHLLILRGATSTWYANEVFGKNATVIRTTLIYDILPWEMPDYPEEKR